MHKSKLLWELVCFLEELCGRLIVPVTQNSQDSVRVICTPLGGHTRRFREARFGWRSIITGNTVIRVQMHGFSVQKVSYYLSYHRTIARRRFCVLPWRITQLRHAYSTLLMLSKNLDCHVINLKSLFVL